MNSHDHVHCVYSHLVLCLYTFYSVSFVSRSQWRRIKARCVANILNSSYRDLIKFLEQLSSIYLPTIALWLLFYPIVFSLELTAYSLHKQMKERALLIDLTKIAQEIISYNDITAASTPMADSAVWVRWLFKLSRHSLGPSVSFACSYGEHRCGRLLRCILR